MNDSVRASMLDTKLKPAVVASIAFARVQGKGLRLLVAPKGMNATKGVISPVEAIRFSRIGMRGDFLATGRDFTLNRSLDQPGAAPAKFTYPIRMLIVMFSPGPPEIDAKVEESRAAIREALKGLAFDALGHALANGPVWVTFYDPPTRDHFQELLRKYGPWHIVHFVGHGAFQPVGEDPTPRAHLLFERPTTRESDPVGATELGVAFNSPSLRLVVLTACSSAAARPREPAEGDPVANSFDVVAHHLLRATDVSAVVAMQFDLEIKAAEVFSREFYRSLLSDGQDIDVAIAQSRREMAEASGLNSGIWITPVLYSRCLNGRVFTFPARLGLAGSVVDAEDLQPVEGIELVIDDVKDIYGKTPKAVTDAAGQFRFEGIPPGPERQVHIRTTSAGNRITPTKAQLGDTSLRIKRISNKSEAE
jgi:hypothetical protein